tara:strand:+ start:2154 stop:3425 length:1272 start_codon:yes stop_codon:yes gene_type:complete
VPEIVAEVVERVRRLLKNGPVSVGQIAFIGLSDLRVGMGPEKWEKFGPAIRRHAESALKDHCVAGDSFIRCSDDQYLVIFSNCSVEAAEVRAAAIGSRILNDVHGEQGMEGVRIFTCAENLDDLDHPDGHTPAEIIQRFRDRSQNTDAGGGQKSSSQDVERAGRRARLRRSLASPNDAPVQYLFNPYWHAPTGRIATFRCSARKLIVGTSRPLSDYHILGANPYPVDIIRFDIDVLEEALLDLTFAIRRGDRVHLVVQLHFETVASRNGQKELREVLQFVPAPLRNLLSFNLSAVPDGAPLSRISEIGVFLHGFGSHLSIDLAAGLSGAVYSDLVAKYAEADVHFISFQLPDVMDGGVLRVATQVIEKAKQHRLSGAVRNLRDRAYLQPLAAAGYEYIAGSAIGVPSLHIPAPWRPEMTGAGK